jgi:hypothetical protein
MADVIAPLLGSPALLPVLAWAAFAALAPLLVRGRFLAIDLIGAAGWGVGLAAAHAGLGDVLAATTVLEQARGGALGAAGAALIAVAAIRAAPAAPETARPETVPAA